MLNADGSFPSEFQDRSEFCGMDNDCAKRKTECLQNYAGIADKETICSGAAQVEKARTEKEAARVAEEKRVAEERAKNVKDFNDNYTGA